MLQRLHSILHPQGFHGHGRKAPYFEGWYFKLVDPSGDHRLAIIPGISLHRDPSRSEAFIQFLDGASGRSHYSRFPLAALSAAPETPQLQIGPNRFGREGLALEISEPEWQIHGRIAFGPFTAWPETLLSPGIMGWYAWVPLMQCYHAVISLDHTLHGALQINGTIVDFSGGRGYAEKDWGTSFPHGYIWLQSNHFPQPGTAFMASVAIIPWLGSTFPGFILGVIHAGQLFRFTTYTGAKIEELLINDREIRLQVANRRHRLSVTAQRSQGGLLQAPDQEGMTARIAETLGGTLSLQLAEARSGRILLEQQGAAAGIDAAGDLDRLRRLAAKQWSVLCV